MTKRFTGFLVLLFMFLNGSCNTSPVNPFLKRFKLEGFEQANTLAVYNKENIFDYINGEAEVYFPFGFQLLCVQSYRESNTGAQMIMEAYDMGTTDGAQGVFRRYSQERGSTVKGLGESAWTDNQIVLFQRGKYFLRVWPDPSLEPIMNPNLNDLLGLSRSLNVILKKFMSMKH